MTTKSDKPSFYLASLFSEREATLSKANEIVSRLGWQNNARWLTGGETGLLRREIAHLDLDDVRASDILVIVSHPRGEPKPGGGRWVEFGYALALGKSIMVIGPYENVFTHHEGVTVYPTLECLIADQEEQV